MNKSLTEQWRDGTLPAGHYYCKLYYNGFKPRIQECVKSAYSPKSCIPMSCGCEGEEILCPVPSYEDICYLNKRLGELAKDVDELQGSFPDLANDYKHLKKQLAIATKALKDMPEMSRAQRALREMEGVK